MRTGTTERVFEVIQEIQRKQRAMRHARERAQSLALSPEVQASDPVEYLRDLLEFPVALLSASSPPPDPRGYAVMRRGSGLPSAQNARAIDDAELRTMERSLGPRAEEILHQVMVTDIPIDVLQVAEELGLFVQETTLSGDLDGCLVTDGRVGGVLINKAIEDPRRRRFTLAHEIGHFVLHKDLPVVREQVDEVGSFFHSMNEKQANTFAGYLLMPPHSVPEDLGKNPPSLAQVDDLAESFDVSLAAALRRIVRESHWRCALVVTRDGIVQWAVRSPYFESYIPTGTRPHRDTSAALLLRTNGPNEDSTRLPAAAWTQGPLVEQDAELSEESRRLDNGYVYTLLTVIEQE
jgi:Zn-dependent peptidase ImmA (M78 family)